MLHARQIITVQAIGAPFNQLTHVVDQTRLNEQDRYPGSLSFSQTYWENNSPETLLLASGLVDWPLKLRYLCGRKVQLLNFSTPTAEANVRMFWRIASGCEHLMSLFPTRTTTKSKSLACWPIVKICSILLPSRKCNTILKCTKTTAASNGKIGYQLLWHSKSVQKSGYFYDSKSRRKGKHKRLMLYRKVAKIFVVINRQHFTIFNSCQSQIVTSVSESENNYVIPQMIFGCSFGGVAHVRVANEQFSGSESLSIFKTHLLCHFLTE